MKITKQEELIVNEIYRVKYNDNYWICRVTEINYKIKAKSISTSGKTYYGNSLWGTTEIFLYYCMLASEEEKIWFEYCESLGEYKEKEESLENYYLKQFIDEYIK